MRTRGVVGGWDTARRRCRHPAERPPLSLVPVPDRPLPDGLHLPQLAELELDGRHLPQLLLRLEGAAPGTCSRRRRRRRRRRGSGRQGDGGRLRHQTHTGGGGGEAGGGGLDRMEAGGPAGQFLLRPQGSLAVLPGLDAVFRRPHLLRGQGRQRQSTAAPAAIL